MRRANPLRPNLPAWALLAPLAALALAAGCSDTGTVGPGDFCRTQDQCPPGTFCFEGECLTTNPLDGDGTDLDLDPVDGTDGDSVTDADVDCVGDDCDADGAIDGDIEVDADEREPIEGNGGRLCLDPETVVDFGFVPMGVDKTKSIIARNCGDERLRIYSVYIEQFSLSAGQVAPEFTLVQSPWQPVEIGPFVDTGDRLTVDVTYLAQNCGADEGRITFVTDGSPITVTVPLRSDIKGTPQIVSDPPADLGVQFPPVAVRTLANPQGNAVTLPVTVWNRARSEEENHCLTVLDVRLQSSTSNDLSLLNRPIFPAQLAAEAPRPGTPVDQQGIGIRFDLKYDPSVTQVLDAEIAIDYVMPGSTTPSTYVLPVTGIAVAPVLSVDPNPMDLGIVPVGRGRCQAMRLSNTGQAMLHITEMQLARGGSDAIVLNTLGQIPASLVTGQQVTVEVCCQPQLPQVATRLIEVLSDSYQLNYALIPVNCVAESCRLEVYPSSLDFGRVRVGDTVTEAVQVTNTGNVSCAIDRIDIQTQTGGSFFFDPVCTGGNPPLQIDSFQSIFACFRFEPAAVDVSRANAFLRVGQLPNLPPVVLTGWAGEPCIELNPARLEAGETEVGFKSEHEIWLHNCGTMDLRVGEIGIDSLGGLPNFVSRFQPFLSVPPDGEKRISIDFTPQVIGVASGRLYVCSDAPNAFNSGGVGVCNDPAMRRHSADLLGRGVDPKLDVRVQNAQGYPGPQIRDNKVDYGTLLPGTDSCVEVVLRNAGARLGVTRIYDMRIAGYNPDFRVGKWVTVSGQQQFRTVEQLYPPDERVPGQPIFSLNPEQADTFFLCYKAPQSMGQAYGALEIQHNVQGIQPRSQYPNYVIRMEAGSVPNAIPVAIAKAYVNASDPGANSDPAIKRGTLNFYVGLETPFYLDARASFDPDTQGTSPPNGLVQSYRWNCPTCLSDRFEFIERNGQTSSQTQVVCHTAGDYFISLEVGDNLRAASDALPDAEIMVHCQACPMAVAVQAITLLDQVTVNINSEVEFTGELSSDPDGRIAWYQWKIFRFRDTNPMAQSEGPDPRWRYRFVEEGEFRIQLRVRDNDGNWSCIDGQMWVSVGFNEPIKMSATWDNGGRVEMHYMCPECDYGRNDCNDRNREPNWNNVGQGYGRPKMTSYDSSGVGPTTIVHDDPTDGPYKIRFDYTYAVEDCNTEAICRYSSNCDDCGCAFGLFCPLCFSRSCEICDGQQTICRKREAQVVLRVYTMNRQIPAKTMIVTLNNNGISGNDFEEVSFVRSRGEWLLGAAPPRPALDPGFVAPFDGVHRDEAIRSRLLVPWDAGVGDVAPLAVPR